MFSKHLAVGGAGELSSTIRVEDEVLRVSMLVECHAQSGDDQRGIEKLAHGPTDDPSGKEIQNRNKV